MSAFVPQICMLFLPNAFAWSENVFSAVVGRSFFSRTDLKRPLNVIFLENFQYGYNYDDIWWKCAFHKFVRIWFRWVFLTWPKCNRWGRIPVVTVFAARSNTLRWSVTRLVCGKCFSLSQLLHPSSHLFADLYKQGFPQIRDVSYFLSESWWIISSKATRTGGAQPEKIFFHGTIPYKLL